MDQPSVFFIDGVPAGELLILMKFNVMATIAGRNRWSSARSEEDSVTVSRMVRAKQQAPSVHDDCEQDAIERL